MTEYLAPPLELNPSGLKTFFDEAMDAFFPGWKPGSGNLADRLAGAQSLIDAQLMEAASDGATNVFRYWGANIAGIPPVEASLATGTTTWVATDTLGHTIPAGTVAIWTNGLGNRVGFETVEPVTIIAGSNTVASVPVRALLSGEEANSISGAATELSSPLAFIASVTMTSPSNGGSEAEEDAAYLTRVAEEAKLLSRKLIVPGDFNTALLRKTGIGRVFTLGGFSPTATQAETVKITTGSKEVTGLATTLTEKLTVGTAVSGVGIEAGSLVTSVGSTTIKISKNATKTENSPLTFTGLLKQPGFLTSWLGNAKGEAATAEEITQITAEIAESLLPGVTWVGQKPNYTTVNVAITVFAWPGQNATTIKEGVEAAIRAYLSPENWGQPPGGQVKEWQNDPKVRIVNTEHAVLQVSGTHYVSSLTLNAGSEDVLMTGVVALPELGTLAVTVNIG